MGVVENVKELADLIKKAGDLELYRRIVELEGEVTEVTRDKRRLGEKVEELEKKLAVKEQMQFRAPFYWQKGDETPYCPRCWESSFRVVHVVFGFGSERPGARWACPDCKQIYDG